jgi:hypothetical protein
MTDDHDDQLRDALHAALHAEADGIHADPSLLDRINAVASTPEPARANRARRVLAVAAALAVAAGTLGLLTQDRDDDQDQRLDVAEDGQSTTSTVVTTTALSTTSIPVVLTTSAPALGATSVPPAGPSAPVGPRLIALVRNDGWLVTVDRTTGEVRELVDGGDPDDPDPTTGVHHFIDDVELSPDGRWVYFSICCDSPRGPFYRVSTTDPDPNVLAQAIGDGKAPRVSPDGRLVASGLETDMLTVARIDPESGSHEVLAGGGTQLNGGYGFISDLAWSPDGTRLAVVNFNDQGSNVIQFQITPDGPVRTGDAAFPAPRGLVTWTPEGRAVAIAPGEPYHRAIRVHQDASYQWQIFVTDDRIVRMSHLANSEAVIVADVPGAIAADW